MRRSPKAIAQHLPQSICKILNAHLNLRLIVCEVLHRFTDAPTTGKALELGHLSKIQRGVVELNKHLAEIVDTTKLEFGDRIGLGLLYTATLHANYFHRLHLNNDGLQVLSTIFNAMCN